MNLVSKINFAGLKRQKGNVMAEYMMVAITVVIAFYFGAVGWKPGETNPLNNMELPDVSGQGAEVPGMIDAMKTQQNNFIKELARP